VVESSARLADHIDVVLAATGASKVHLVGHSLGGVVVRHAVELGGVGDRVATAVTICAPHGGTPWAHPARVLPSWAVLRTVSQLRVGSSLLRRIEEAAAANAAARLHSVRWVAFYANTDWVVPAGRARIRAGEDVTNVLLRDEGHLSPMVTDLIAGQVAEVLVAHESARGAFSAA
jgi:pimeloyl-ACP methyl ester carboxylesterase